ncbi:MAG: nitronate monooxygenase [Acidimicrobiales bacterium]
MRGPVVVAPMAGGPMTVELVGAAGAAGALGILAAGYKPVDAMKAEIDSVRAATGEAFGINLFVPGTPTAEPAEVSRYLDSVVPDAESVGATLGGHQWDDDGWSAKVGAVLADPPPLVSFTFGCPDAEIIDALRAAGSVVVVTVTDPGESRLAAGREADALCVQGIEAGAHRGSFTNDRHPGGGSGLLPLIAEVARATDLPLIAAGGIMGPEDVTAALGAGAVAVQCGTAFLRCPESGAHPTHKAALADSRFTATAFTRSFSGRPARGLVNQFMLDHPEAPAAYPEINNATRPLRGAAAQQGDVDRMGLWGGTGFRRATPHPAGEVIERLSRGHGPR